MCTDPFRMLAEYYNFVSNLLVKQQDIVFVRQKLTKKKFLYFQVGMSHKSSV